MFLSAEQEKRIHAAQEIMRPEKKAHGLSLCQYKHLSCVRCCLPHIGGDPYIDESGRYLGPGNLAVKFTNFNPMQDPKIAASQYEDSFQDVGREEMERRFIRRRALFQAIYDPKQPRTSLPRYMEAAKQSEAYRHKPNANSGLVSMYLGGSVPTGHLEKGELPECHLLGFIDRKRRVGCLAHPLAETSHGYDGRDQVGFFDHTGCCESVGCEAGKEFRYLSPSALRIFDEATKGMPWYEFSRHATSVLVYYLRSYDHLLQRLDERYLPDWPTWVELVEFTNSLYDEWPLRKLLRGEDSDPLDSLSILSIDIPLPERIMYIALDTKFSRHNIARQLSQARDFLERRVKALPWQFGANLS